MLVSALRTAFVSKMHPRPCRLPPPSLQGHSPQDQQKGLRRTHEPSQHRERERLTLCHHVTLRRGQVKEVGPDTSDVDRDFQVYVALQCLLQFRL